jgi:hypothetical protein
LLDVARRRDYILAAMMTVATLSTRRRRLPEAAMAFDRI